MSTNGNGRWFQSYWKRGVKVVPREAGWYAAIPENCDRCMVRVHLEPDLFFCKVEGDELIHDVYDYSHWYRLKSPYENLPEFP